MDRLRRLEWTKAAGTGLSFILFPLVFVFAFAGHPGLLDPHILDPEELILRSHGDSLLAFGHALVTLNTALLVVAALHFQKVLASTKGAWPGFIGGALAVLGALILAADKGALCLTMSAIHGQELEPMMPGLLAMFGKQGWLFLLWGLLFLPIGFAVQAVALIHTRVIPRWQGVGFLIGVLFIGFPDGAEIINLSASLLLSAVFVPYGIRLIRQARRPRESTPPNDALPA